VLRPDPKSFDTVDASQIWQRHRGGGGGGGGVGGGPEMREVRHPLARATRGQWLREAAGLTPGALIPYSPARAARDHPGTTPQHQVLSELAALRAQVAQLNELLHTAVPSLPPSPAGEPRSP
jgi:hypothetical protein